MDSDRRHCIYLVDYAASFDLFSRFISASNDSEHILITSLFSVYIKSLSHNKINKTYLLNRWSGSSSIKKVDLSRCREVKLGILDETAALKYFSATVHILLQLTMNRNSIVYVWNGDSIVGEATRFVKSKVGVRLCKCLYFEIANLPGKLFCDPLGVNRASYLFERPELLDEYSYNLREFEDWKKGFIESKLSGYLPPQASLSKKLSWANVADLVASSIFAYRLYSGSSVKTKLKSILSKIKKPEKFEQDTNLPFEDFVFFPMQVSTDTQLLLNSDYNNLSAIDYILKKTDTPLVVKPHPVESDLNYLIEYVSHHRDKQRIFISNADTYMLIDKAKMVIVINSTVGFEAMLMNKSVEFLGRTFYAHLNGDGVGRYVMGYLLDVDFFDARQAISQKTMDECIKRSQINTVF